MLAMSYVELGSVVPPVMSAVAFWLKSVTRKLPLTFKSASMPPVMFASELPPRVPPARNCVTWGSGTPATGRVPMSMTCTLWPMARVWKR